MKEELKNERRRKVTPSYEEIEARIEEVEVKNICGKRTRMQCEDYIFLVEAPNSITHLDVDVQQHLQQ